MKNSDQALRSFFGARVGGQDRPQDVYTPQCVIDAILRVWPEGIALDPCSSRDAIVPAKERICAPITPGDPDGCLVNWPDFTYANPPFKELKIWMEKPKRGYEHMMLVPVRPLRNWWCDSANGSTRVCWLRPVRFCGHTSSFPAPLAMLYYGSRCDAFDNAFKPLGKVGILYVYNSY